MFPYFGRTEKKSSHSLKYLKNVLVSIKTAIVTLSIHHLIFNLKTNHFNYNRKEMLNLLHELTNDTKITVS